MTSDNLLPPHDIGAEEAVNGSLLIDGQAIREIVNTLKVDDFYNEANRNIFAVCKGLYEAGTAIDQVTVAEALNRSDKLEPSGGAAYLSHLIAVVPTSLDISHYADIVAKLAASRDMIAVGRQIQDIGHRADPDLEGSLSKVAEIVDGLKKGRGGHHIITPEQRVLRAFDRYHALYTQERGIAVTTGLIDLNKALGGGMFPGELLILAARPSMGKTTLAETISRHAQVQGPVLFCSGEMNVDGLTDRDIAGLTGRPIDDIRAGGYDDELFDDIVTKLPILEAIDVYHLNRERSFAFNTSNVYHAAYSLKERAGLSLLVIDYLSLLTDRYGSSANERTGYLSGRIKEIAVDLDVPVLCLHQLNRAVEHRDEKVPKLHDLRDSGSVEQDADIVMFLHRDSYYDKATESDLASVYMAKKRQGQGRKGKRVTLQWNETGQAYENTLSDRVEGE